MLGDGSQRFYSFQMLDETLGRLNTSPNICKICWLKLWVKRCIVNIGLKRRNSTFPKVLLVLIGQISRVNFKFQGPKLKGHISRINDFPCIDLDNE